MKKDTKEKKEKKVGTKPRSKKVGIAKKGAEPIKGDVNRPGYAIFFISPDDQKKQNDLVNTGKVFSIVAISNATPNDKPDELAYFVKS